MRGNKRVLVTGLCALVLPALVWGCGTSPVDVTSQFMKVDSSSKTVTLDLVAGYNAEDNYRNFDGYSNGQMTITVPVGYTVKLNYSNQSGIPTDVGVYGQNGELAFKGAGESVQYMALNPGTGLYPGDTESFTFVASKAGNYQLANYLDRFGQFQEIAQQHQTMDMWDNFDVVASGTPSVTAK